MTNNLLITSVPASQIPLRKFGSVKLTSARASDHSVKIEFEPLNEFCRIEALLHNDTAGKNSCDRKLEIYTDPLSMSTKK